MRIYPVIMCGGAGTRLWPASTAARPKQFLPLLGPRSTFQEAALRIAGVEPLGQILVISGEAYGKLVQEQLREVGVSAVLLLEPAARDSAAAMAAAAVWIEARDPDGVAAVVSADHHMPDAEAFRRAVGRAAAGAAQGAIVTLGVTPSAPSTAYGYIRPDRGAEGLHRVAAFVEKPDAATATDYVARGYLWNSGNFIVAVRTLVGELERYAPEVLAAARAAVAGATDAEGGALLGQAFLRAPRISIDYAVMEKTEAAAVLPVDFAWSDLGAWDAIWAASARDPAGNVASPGVLLHGASNVLARTPPGRRLGVIGVRDLAVVVEEDDVLVCAMERSQDVKKAAEAFAGAPAHAFPDLDTAAAWYARWLSSEALPVWWCLGADHAHGGFHEELNEAARPTPALRRARVQCRQVYSYAAAGRLGWTGPWREAAAHGWRFFHDHYLRPDGLYRTVVRPDGAPVDETPYLYDQAFALLALSALQGADPSQDLPRTQALANLRSLSALRHVRGGFREAGTQTYQANAHMHLLEACMAWTELGVPEFRPVAEQVVELALDKFIDPEGGFLREFFDDAWRPARGEDGRLVEPGHQFEWAWLMARWSGLAGSSAAGDAARRLFDAGCRGVDLRRAVAVNALWDDLSVRDAEARLWPQTEYLKAAMILGEPEHALRAATGLRSYLATPVGGLWRDKQTPEGRFRDEPSPASSFYHIAAACEALAERETFRL